MGRNSNNIRHEFLFKTQNLNGTLIQVMFGVNSYSGCEIWMGFKFKLHTLCMHLVYIYAMEINKTYII